MKKDDQSGHRARVVAEVVHARMLQGFAELVRSLGGDPAEFPIWTNLTVTGAPPTYRQVIALLEAASATLGCPAFGIRLAVLQDGGTTFGPLGQVMTSSGTLAEALRYVCKHSYAHSLAAQIWMSEADEGATFVGHDLTIEGAPLRAQTIEQILLSGNIAVRQLTGGVARARRVHFRHLPVSPPRLYRKYFGCDVRFGQNEDGVLYAAGDMLAKIVSRDPVRYDSAIRHVEQTFAGRHAPPFHQQVRGIVMRRLALGACDAAAVADSLSLHPRTLQRRLLAEGSSFQAVKDEVRRETLFYYLRFTAVDLVTVSTKLGFSEQAVLSRRCRLWFGKTPSELRQESRA